MNRIILPTTTYCSTRQKAGCTLGWASWLFAVGALALWIGGNR